jgi:hypothetical protein
MRQTMMVGICASQPSRTSGGQIASAISRRATREPAKTRAVRVSAHEFMRQG